jgi:TRAP-type C4-dicarboxylate transport system permease small subunit
MKMNKLAKFAVIAGTLGLMALPIASYAATTFSIVSIDVGLGTADLKDTVLNVIRLVLGLMTLVAVVLIIYGGFTWLTAAGNEENVEKAKKIISAAVIGLIIILLAWAIVIFVAKTTANVTTNT